MKVVMLLVLTLSVIRISGVSKGIMLGNDSLHTTTVLYKVTHPESQYISYLFGTHHAFGKSFFDSLKFAKDALLTADILIKENLNIPGQLAEDIINKRPTNIRWNKYLGREALTYVEVLFSTSNLHFDKMSPAELYAFLSRYYKESVCLKKGVEEENLSLDDYIGKVAEQHQVKVIGLETTEEQIALINDDLRGMPRKVHKRRLKRMIARLQAKTDDHCAEIEWYRQMNFDFKLNQACQNTLILSDRNAKWLSSVQNYFSTNNCFVAVGLSHLMYECGLINSLLRMGYTINPIEVK